MEKIETTDINSGSLREKIKEYLGDKDARTPLDFKYIDYVSFMLSTVGSWPHRKFGRPRLDTCLSLYSLVLASLGTFGSSLCGVYLWVHRERITFNDMGHILLTMALGYLGWTRVWIARLGKYRETVKEWLLEFHMFYFKNRSEYAAKVNSQIHIISGLLCVYIQGLMFIGVTMFNFHPWYENYSTGVLGENRPANATFKQAVYYYVITDKPYSTINGYWTLFAINIYISYNVTCGLFVFDLLLCLIVLQIWGHIQILQHNLLHFPLPESGNGMYSVEENVQIRALLKDNIVHHNLITRFVDRCSDTFSEYLLLLYFLLQIISCILLLEISALTAEAFAKYGTLMVGMHQQLIQVSVLFEMLNTKSEQLIDAVYEVPWECMDTSNRRTVMLLLHRVQTPLSLKAGKVVPVGVQTMSSVLKTTCSYYMVLRTVARER